MVENILHHHSGKLSIPPQKAAEISKVKELNKSHDQNTIRASGDLDGLKTFIHNTGDRLEEIEGGIFVCRHQRIKIHGELDLGRMRNYFVTLSPIFLKNN